MTKELHWQWSPQASRKRRTSAVLGGASAWSAGVLVKEPRGPCEGAPLLVSILVSLPPMLMILKASHPVSSSPGLLGMRYSV